MDKKQLFEKLFEEANRKDSFNGTWLYAEGGKIVSKGALGFRDFEDKLPMREDSVFQLASITKQFTAAAVMLLAREGKLKLEDEVVGIFPNLPLANVTIRHLLTHTGGVPETYDYNMITKIYEEEHRIPDHSVVLRFLEEGDGAIFPAGERFEYTNGGYNLLAEIVAKVSGMPFEEFLKRRIFEPAGMYHTGIYHIWREGIPHDNFVRNMAWENGARIPVTESEDADVVAFDGLNGDDYVYTDIFDMFLWDRVLHGEHILTQAERDIMYTPGRLNDGSASGAGDEKDGYGFGWEIFHDPKLGLVVKHGGGMPGLSTWFERFVDADRVLVILNCRLSGDERGAFHLWKAARQIAMDLDPEPFELIEDIAARYPDHSGWETYCGKYAHEDGAEFYVDEVRLEEGTDGNAVNGADGKDGADGKGSNDTYLVVHGFDGGDEFSFRLYPIGDHEFGRKDTWTTYRFEDGKLVFDDNSFEKM